MKRKHMAVGAFDDMANVTKLEKPVERKACHTENDGVRTTSRFSKKTVRIARNREKVK